MKNAFESHNNIEKISFPNGEFTVDSKSLPERHKDFWKQFSGNWEEENRKSLSTFIDPETVVVDLGAWVGPITLLSASLGAEHVYAFEPDNSAYKFLKENYLLNPKLKEKITLFNSAIAKDDGQINIGPLTNRELGESTTSIHGTQLSPVNAMSVDSMFKNCHLDSVVKICIKIDIEGSEKYILEDICEKLSKIEKPFLLIIEMHPYHFNKQDSQKIEKTIEKLISISDNFVFQNRRRIGEKIIYKDTDTGWRSELYNPNGLFDLTFQKK